MTKKTRKTDSQSGQHKSHNTFRSRFGALVPFQRRRQQEGEGLLHTHEPFVTNPTTSVGHEGPSSVFEEVRCYLRIRELVLKSFHAVNHIQSIAADVENVSAVVLKPSTFTSPGETTGEGRATATHEVRAHAAMHCWRLSIPPGARRYPTCSDTTRPHTGRTYGPHSWPSGDCC